MKGTSGPETVSTKLQRIAELARQAPTMVFTTLAHHIHMDFLREAYQRTRKDGAAGVDGQTAADYAGERPPRGTPDGGNAGSGSFDLLGFTHHWAKSLRGSWVVRRKTAQSRFGRALKRVAEWCRCNRHLPVAVQHQTLSQKLRGHYAYFGITGNGSAISRFLYEVTCAWRLWLDRRSQRAKMTWPRFEKLLERYPLPKPIVVQSVYRLAAKP